mgnify:FL=1
MALVCCAACGFDTSGSGAGGGSGDTTGGVGDSTSQGVITTPTGSASDEGTSVDDGNADTGVANTDGADDTSGADTTEDDTTTEAVVSCTRTHEIVALVEDAVLTGSWTLESSGIGEGTYANPNGNEAQGTEGTITFSFDVPCADDWYVWIRFYDWGSQDSWYVRVDGEPGPKEAIAEGDCTPAGHNWDWALLNYRDREAPDCEYVYDPWVQTWNAGEHTVEFEILEHSSLARLVIVNDPDFMP